MLEVVEVELVPGTVVANKWRLERPLGKGGFGIVWAAVDVATGAPCALKCLTGEGATDTKRQERLRQEARVMSAISHPNIARVFGVEELPAGTPFIVMELLRGPTLHERLARGPMSVAQGLGILVQIADALRTVHARNLIHRDLKPANVVIVDDHTVKVLDFGIAKDLNAGDRHKLTTTGTALGTLYYMAPEQIFGEKNLDPRCDVWALGVIVHECLTLSRPSDADGNSGQVLKKILEGDFPRLATLVANCPPYLDDLVARMLSRKPADRPTSEEVFATLFRPMNNATVPGSLMKTNFMLQTLPMSAAPQLMRTVRDEKFVGSQLVPSTVVPPTLLASSPPGSVVPSTVVPSTVLAATAMSADFVPPTVVPPTLLAGPGAAPVSPLAYSSDNMAAVTPGYVPVRQAEVSTFDARPRAVNPRTRVVAVALAVLAGLAALGIGLVAFVAPRLRRAEIAHDETPTATASETPTASASIATTAPLSSAVSAPAPSATAAQTSAAAVAAASASAPKTHASAPATPPHHAAAASAGRTAPSPGGKDDPPITNERF